ncbi:unnamed protein product [Notodromas monacha]|uniref:UGGT thioredoxin-like domain-containing protein n=1 Tax=Notodromas monacha TaxID=399045 RepID=A0A7R9BQB5_9CRUS|nr:unnamed protein product [Notodromas monacha]CAG0918617.1 unnamed protein product [Notodromas monacha]
MFRQIAADRGFVSSIPTETDKEYYDLVLETAERYLTAGRVRLLKFALSLRYYSPRIEMFRQIAADRGVPKNCAAVVEINGVMTCNPGDIDRLVTSATSGSAAEVLQMDHRHPESDASSTTRAVLYAEPGSVGFQAFHDQLGSLATQRHVDYIFRPFVRDYDEADSRRVRLSGYGVELQMKSTEYKAQDDAKVDDEDRATDDEDKVDEIEGFVFSRLSSVKRNPRDP